MYYLLAVILSHTVTSRKMANKPPASTTTTTSTMNTSTTTTTTTTATTTNTTSNKAIKIPNKKDEGVDTTGSWPLLGEMDEGSKVDVNNKAKPPKTEKTAVKVKEEEDVEGKNGKANKRKGKC